MKRATAFILALIICAGMIAGCSGGTENDTALTPEPAFTPGVTANPESVKNKTLTLQLYFPNKSKTKLISETRTFEALFSVSEAEAAMDELIKGTSRTDGLSLFPEGMYVINIEQTGGIATVDVSSEFRELEDPFDAYLARICIVNTLTLIKGIEYVSLLVDGSDPGILGLPCGAMAKYTSDINTRYNEYSAIAEQIASGGTGENPEGDSPLLAPRRAMLYYRDAKSRYIFPELRNITTNASDMASCAATIANELISGPQSSRLMALIPSETYLAEPPVLKENDDGKYDITLTFSSGMKQGLENDPVGFDHLIGSIVFSITSFVPDISSVIICIENEMVAGLSNGTTFPGGRMKRSDFREFLGSYISIYMPSATHNGISPVSRAVPYMTARTAQTRLRELLRGALMRDENVVSLFDDSIGTDDISVYCIKNDVIYISLSDSLYSWLDDKSLKDSRITVYSIVNTLTELPNIKSVQFLHGKEYAEKWGEHIYIQDPLIKNIGLVQTAQ